MIRPPTPTPTPHPTAIAARRTLRLVLVASLATLLPACGDTGALRPPEIRLGEDVCAVCGMAVSDGRYAAAVVVRRNARDQVLLLDDLGELAQVTLPEHDQAAIFVRDERTQAWLDGASAHYIKSPQIRTPMGFGIAALGSESEAEARRAETSGVRLDSRDLRPDRPAQPDP